MTNLLFETLAKHAASDSIAVRVPAAAQDSDASWTYTQLFERAAQAATLLAESGVGPGDRVAMQCVKCVDALALYLGCAQAGAAFLPLNTAYTAKEISYFLDDAEVSLFICSPLMAQQSAFDASLQVLTIDGQGQGSFEKAVKAAKPSGDVADVQPADLGAILYTSGTTGRSKGAMLSQENLASNTEVLVDYWKFNDADILLHALPIYHTHGLFVASNVVLATGASMLFHSAFNVDAVVADLPSATSMMGVPTFYTRLLADRRFDKSLTSHMRLFTSGSAPMLLETHLEFEKVTGQRILERYGMTETGMLTSNPYASDLGERKPGTVGFPLPGVDLRVVDPDASGKATEVKTGDIGMIEVKGPNVFSGYWRMPEKTAEEFRDDGYFVTGDLGTRDSDGYISIVGRNKDLIITGGFNVYPKEIELLIDDQHGVVESAVIGLPHPDFGEAVTALLVLENSKTGGDEDSSHSSLIDSIKSVAAEELAKFKQPKNYLVLEELPRNTMGKVQKNELRKQFDALYKT